MAKKVLDTNIVLMGLLAGAHAKDERRSIKSLIGLFKKLGRVLIPTSRDYEKAGEILIRLQSIKGYDIRKSASITNDQYRMSLNLKSPLFKERATDEN